MRLRMMALVGGVAFVCGLAGAQQTATMLPNVLPPPLPMGGIVGSYSLHAVTGQPYSMVQRTISVKTLADGTKMTTIREERTSRDSQGRERSESGVVRDGVLQNSMIRLTDPVGRTIATLFPSSHRAIVNHTREAKLPTPEEAAKAEELRAKFEQYRKEHPLQRTTSSGTESLPGQMMSGVYVEGRRLTLTIPVGKEGNDREIHVVEETWSSPDLKVKIASTTDDPRFGTIKTETTQLSRVEPDAALFQIPPEYTVQDNKR